MPSVARQEIQRGLPQTGDGSRTPRLTKKTLLRSVKTWEVAPKETAARLPDREVAPDRGDHHPAMAMYLQDLRRHPLLSREEEHRIAVLFSQTRDPGLASQLVTANLRLVVKIVLEYRSAHRNLLDLVQEGNVGLIHAVQKYDPHRGVKVGTYASWWIRAYVLKFILSNSRLVKVGTTQGQRRLFFGLRRERARLEGPDGKTVEARHLAAVFDVSEKEVVEMERRLSSCETSIDSPSGGDDRGDRTYGDSLSGEAALQPDVQSEVREFQDVLKRELGTFQETLTGRDIEIFRGRLVSDEAATLAEIAERFGVSRERVRQIEERLKQRLRRHLQASLGDAVPMTSAASA
jgi:RNA polymerase sigma-32 factor